MYVLLLLSTFIYCVYACVYVCECSVCDSMWMCYCVYTRLYQRCVLFCACMGICMYMCMPCSSKTTYRTQFFHSITRVLRPNLRLRQHSPLPTKHFLPVSLFCCLFEADRMYFRLVLNSLFSSNDLESLIITTLSPHEDWNCGACTPCLICGVLEMEPQALCKPITKLSYSTSPRVSNRNARF